PATVYRRPESHYVRSLARYTKRHEPPHGTTGAIMDMQCRHGTGETLPYRAVRVSGNARVLGLPRRPPVFPQKIGAGVDTDDDFVYQPGR
ncbi:MAG: hypothetical protein ACYSW7_12195, partial [Planctomycetota bacterium]